MASFVPVVLSGDNLGQKHRHLNALVHEAHSKGFEYGGDLIRGESVLDRLLKIDLANKDQNVDYILKILKNIETTMLYVKKALKSTWLLQRKDIINPKYLDEVLFQEMLLPAVAKMKHWLYINLREPSMCQEFYLYYKEKEFEFAVKFLNHCSDEFIMGEVPNVLIKLSPHYLKVLSEKCPKVAKIYFDTLESNEELRARYLSREQSYYNSIKCVLKMDAEVFLDITEKYFNMKSFSRLSASQSDYIMKNYKSRFMNKLELYIGYLLHIPTVARRLSVQECEDAVIRLAQATYLQHWFTYKAVEPLVKRLRPDSRAAFKKKVFVQKEIGDYVKEWQYTIPAPPVLPDSGPHLFDDQNYKPVPILFVNFILKKKKRGRGRFEEWTIPLESRVLESRTKSELDRLFDEFRFIGFDRALHDLGQRLKVAGSADRRRDMFLVLVSKSGGCSDAVSALLRLAARHNNEPVHIRAAVIRSLVKRAHVWRLAADIWQHLLEFGHGLGLDGSAPEANCLEGLHAVIIRQLLIGECEPAIVSAFLDNFSTLKEYSLSPEERMRVVIGLQNMLLSSAEHAEPEIATDYLNKLLDTLNTYGIKVGPSSPMVRAVMALAKRDADIARPLLGRLYNAKIARRELFRMNLKFRRDEATFLNALRHDPDALDLNHVVDVLASSATASFDRFVSKLVIYFGHTDCFVKQLPRTLMDKIVEKFNAKSVRGLAVLLGQDLEAEIKKLDEEGTDRKQLAAALRACAHLSLHNKSIFKMDWHKAGVKAIATRVICSPEVDRARLTSELASDRHTIRVALALSTRTQSEFVLKTFKSAVELRRSAALRAALKYFRRYGDMADPRVWDIVKPVILSINLKRRKYLCRQLENIGCIPSTIRADYCVTLYLALNKISLSRPAWYYSNLLLFELLKLLHEANSVDVKPCIDLETVLLRILENQFPFPAIVIRYLMLSKNQEELTERFEKIGDRFLSYLDTMRCNDNDSFKRLLTQTMQSLQYNAAFFNCKITTCFSVMEKILAWMQTFMPKEKFFKDYVLIHLTMLYFKAVRQSMKQMPDVFADEKRKKSEGAEVVGFVFGKYIAREVAELVNKYFDSVVELYSDALGEYLRNYFMFRSSRAEFIGAIIKGMWSESGGHQRRMAVYVYNKSCSSMSNVLKNVIEELITNDKSMELFIYGLM